MSFAKTLSRDEMKKVMAGGGGCHVDCCSGPDSCSGELKHCTECDATNAEDCQQQAIDNGWTCLRDDQFISGYYHPEVA